MMVRENMVSWYVILSGRETRDFQDNVTGLVAHGTVRRH